MKSQKWNKVSLWITMCFNILVVSFTASSYVKSISEKFCFSRRPGEMISSGKLDHSVGIVYNYPGLFYGRVQNISIDYIQDVDCLEYSSDKCNRDVTEVSFKKWLVPSLQEAIPGKYSYSLMSSKVGFGFDLEIFYDPKYYFIHCEGGEKTEVNQDEIYQALYITPDSVGYISRAFYSESKMVQTFGNCTYSTYYKTCSFKPEYQDYFVYVSLLLCFIVGALMIVCSMSSTLSYYFVISVVKFVSPSKMKLWEFCNPLDGSFSVFEIGESVLKLVKNPDGWNINDFYGECNTLVTENYCMNIGLRKRTLTISRRDSCDLIFEGRLSKLKLRQVSHLMFLLSSNVKYWPVEGVREHHVSMESFLKDFLLGDYSLNFEACKRRTVYKGLDLKTFMEEGFGIGNKLSEVLITHNKTFFKEVNLAGLFKAVSGECGWTDRPLSIKNSQWKRYTNDVSIIMGSLNYKVKFHQLKNKGVKMTKAVTEALDRPEDIDLDLDGIKKRSKLKGLQKDLKKVMRMKRHGMEREYLEKAGVDPESDGLNTVIKKVLNSERRSYLEKLETHKLCLDRFKELNARGEELKKYFWKQGYNPLLEFERNLEVNKKNKKISNRLLQNEEELRKAQEENRVISKTPSPMSPSIQDVGFLIKECIGSRDSYNEERVEEIKNMVDVPIKESESKFSYYRSFFKLTGGRKQNCLRKQLVNLGRSGGENKASVNSGVETYNIYSVLFEEATGQPYCPGESKGAPRKEHKGKMTKEDRKSRKLMNKERVDGVGRSTKPIGKMKPKFLTMKGCNFSGDLSLKGEVSCSFKQKRFDSNYRSNIVFRRFQKRQGQSEEILSFKDIFTRAGGGGRRPWGDKATRNLAVESIYGIIEKERSDLYHKVYRRHNGSLRGWDNWDDFKDQDLKDKDIDERLS